MVEEIFEKSLRGSGLKELCKELNERGITNRGKRWNKGGLHYVLRNEAYTGAAVWGKASKGEKAQDPVRVEGAWPALVSRELLDDVQQAMSDRAPKVQRPARVGSPYLLSGLLRCVEGAARRRAAGDERPSPEGAEARQGGQSVPSERPLALWGVRQALLGPGSQERPVRLLHLRHPVQRRLILCSLVGREWPGLAPSALSYLISNNIEATR